MLEIIKKQWRNLFAGLPIRRKLMVLHNLFFVVLVLSLYFALRSPISQVAARSAEQEAELLAQVLEQYPGALQSVQSERFTILNEKDTALIITLEMQAWLQQNPHRVWRDRIEIPRSSIPLFRLVRVEPNSQTFQIIALNSDHYLQLSRQLRWMLGIVLLVIYLLAVMVLEFFILPRYVYYPVRRILLADEALQADNKKSELIDETLISNDELGQITLSRNATVKRLRMREDELKNALSQVEEATSDLKRKNHLLETAQSNLATQDRLISIGMMSAGVAHEINTPLAVLHGSIEKMLETCTDTESEGRLRRMLRVTERLRGISESLTDFARARTQTMEAVPLKPILDEAWALVGIEAKGVHLEFVNQVKNQDIVVGNSGRLLQVFVNLLKNGVYAIQDNNKSGVKVKGLLGVRTDYLSQDRQLWIRVIIEDNGSGIPSEVLPHIFEPFVTSRLDANGTGLGLAVTAGIIDQHGGLIVANNRPEGGAKFEITLPVRLAETKA
jgi:C4-dicarboxylate-specific signal transduction histidine kinase